jgi:hypothetical protein
MRTVALSVLVTLFLAPSAFAAWVPPVEGPVVGRFRAGTNPFAAGQRRGVDLAAAPGARVVAPCSGRVTFAGRVPRFGLGVSLRCGRLTATVLGLGGGLPRPEVLVHRGEAIGRVGLGGRVRLGARVTRLRFGYRDPLALLGVDPAARAPLVGPRGSARRPAPPAPTPLVPRAAPSPSPSAPPAAVPAGEPTPSPNASARPAPTPAGEPTPSPDHSGAPALAWVGLALIACALPSGAIAWRVRRRSAPLARQRPSRPH